MGHFWADILPYYLYGNMPNDRGTMDRFSITKDIVIEKFIKSLPYQNISNYHYTN